MTTNQLAIRDNQIALSDLGTILTKSGYFQDARDASQAIVKVLAGQELGFGPIASMTGINIIKGRVSLSANIIAASVKRSGRYNYRVKEQTDEACKIEFFERMGDKWESVGISTFNAADAKRAGTQNMDKFPRNMLFARAMSNGAKWYCADIFGGPIYTPDELGAQVDAETGEVIPGTFEEVQPQPEPARAPEQPKAQPPQAAASRPLEPHALAEYMAKKAKNYAGRTCSDEQRNLTAAMLAMIFQNDDDKRHTCQEFLFSATSIKDAAPEMIWAALDWLKPAKDTGGAYTPDFMAEREAHMVYSAAIQGEGQQELPL